ncbi:MAG: hypothetical protein JSV96_11975 [Candidatus Aminicenantes bacterium]|nr:MAG: hypothetical protein JSV96_11975 [Candidatus Aminicenantes bacterium]
MTKDKGSNKKVCRRWWRNCGVEPDNEILSIDKMEDEISPLAPTTIRIRELISTLELCHHKAERWVYNIIEAIGLWVTVKGLGTRPPGQIHPVERIWQAACTALSAWCAGSPAASVDITLGNRQASQVLSHLGKRSNLKEWQVQRVIERIRELIGWSESKQNDSTGYVPMLECGGDYESVKRTECPEYYREHADYWQQTVQTFIHDAEVGIHHSIYGDSVYGDSPYGETSEQSLAIAIDMLWPCHWNFIKNLEIVLGAIGGNLNPKIPFAFCARNIKLSPIRDRMKVISYTLQIFCQKQRPDNKVDASLLDLMGKTSKTKKWLASSLDKTIRIQLDL